MAVVVLVFGALAMLGGTVVGGRMTPISVYGLLFTMCGLYMIAGLAIRDRTWKRLRNPEGPVTTSERLVGRRVF